MAGIEKLKDAISVLLTIGMKYDKVSEDGKITTAEIIGLSMSGLALWRVVKYRKDIIAEYKDLDEAEKTTLREYFVEEFDIRNDKIEVIIEKAFQFALELGALIESFSKEL